MGCPVAVIFYLFILWVIKLFDVDLTPFCCLVFSYQHIGTSVSSIIVALEMLHTAPLLLLLCILRTFPYSLYLGTFLIDPEHLHGQKCSVHTMLMVNVCLYFRIWYLGFSLGLHCIHLVSIPLIDWF